MYEIESRLISRPIADIPATVSAQMARWTGWSRLKPGARVAITAGSRGVASIPVILRAVCDDLKRRGYRPFIVPAMGSHGGAIVEGQISLLAELGVTPQSVGAPIEGGLDVDEVGRSSRGQPVVMDARARRADGLIIVGRVKKHTDFNGAVESGLMKMIVIGLGKHYQASHVHSFGAEGLRTLIPEFASIAIANSPIIFGLAVLEDGYHAASDIVMAPAAEIAAEEPKLLRKAVRQMARLPICDIDLLIVNYVGKDISGAGMDTNVIGRYWVRGVPEPKSPRVRYLIALDVTPASHGNAIGIGLADLTTQRLVSKIDHVSYYMNASTSGFLERTKIPLTCPSDQAAIDLALRLLAPLPAEQARIVRIQDTLHLTHFTASAATLDDLRAAPRVTVGQPVGPLAFGGDGVLLQPGSVGPPAPNARYSGAGSPGGA
jgi:hypothetical protein